MPCHNTAPFLAEALRSVLDQAPGDLEVLLVDDGSTDDPGAVVRRIDDGRIRFRSIPASGGPSHPRNLGVADARGDVIFFFDADDVMLPGKIKAQMAAFAADPQLAMTFTNFRVIDARGDVINPDFLAGYDTFREVLATRRAPRGVLDREAMYHGLLRASFVGTSGVAVRRRALVRAGGFDTGLASGEDVDLWLRIVRDDDCGYVDIIGHSYRRHPSSVMQRVDPRHPRSRNEILGRHLPKITDPATARIVRRRMAANHVELGYISQKWGDAREARRSYLEALRLAPGLGALAGYVKCVLGGPFLRRGLRPGDRGGSR